MNTPRQRFSGEGSVGEPPVDVRRYLGTLRRSWLLIACVVVVVTGAVVAISLILPSIYEARATVVVSMDNGLLGSPDADTQQRRLATLDELMTSPRVLGKASAELPEVTRSDLDDEVTASVNPQANLVDVIASDEDPKLAARMANTVARTFLAEQTKLESSQIERAIADLQGALGGNLGETRQRIAELRVQLASAGSDLQIAEPAVPPDTPASPRPVRNGIVAFFGSLFLGVLIALARGQLRPAISSPRELSRMTGLPVLAGIPYVRKRLARRRQMVTAIEHEAYRTLAVELQLALPPSEQRVILVTSALHGEGKTTVSARLGRVLAEAGHDCLVISGDVRWPDLHELLGVRLSPGLADLLIAARRDGYLDRGVLAKAVQAVPAGLGDPENSGELGVIAAGSKRADPATLFSPEALKALFEQIRSLPVAYVLVDCPPALGIADVQRLAQEGDHLVLVSRLDRVTIDNVADMQELLARLPVRRLGHVVIGARIEVSPYYLGERPPIVTPGPRVPAEAPAPTEAGPGR
jgi:tyrosine-protein kinase